jgi:hypothetical protein
MKKTPADPIKKLSRELSRLRERAGSLENFIDGYVMPEYAMKEMVAAFRDMSRLQAKIDAEETAGMAEAAAKITSEKKLAAFLAKVSRLSETNCSAFGEMLRVVGAVKEQCVGAELSETAKHMLSTACVADIFLSATSLQAQMLGAMRKIPERRRLEKTRKIEDELWLGFADMIVRTVGGSEPTLDDILAEMGQNDAPDGIGQLVAYGADADRARLEIKTQAYKHILRNAGAMTACGGDWVTLFLADMSGAWQRFESNRREGLYDPYDPAEDLMTEARKNARTQVEIFQFPMEKIKERQR